MSERDTMIFIEARLEQCKLAMQNALLLREKDIAIACEQAFGTFDFVAEVKKVCIEELNRTLHAHIRQAVGVVVANVTDAIARQIVENITKETP